MNAAEQEIEMAASHELIEAATDAFPITHPAYQLVADPTSGATGLAIWWANGTLQSTTNLAAPNWQNVPTTNGQISIRINPALPCQFFRVVQP